MIRGRRRRRRRKGIRLCVTLSSTSRYRGKRREPDKSRDVALSSASIFLRVERENREGGESPDIFRPARTERESASGTERSSTISKRDRPTTSNRFRPALIHRINVEDRCPLLRTPTRDTQIITTKRVRFALWNIVTRHAPRLLSSECKQCNESYERFPFTIPQHHCVYRFPFTIGASGHADEKRPRKLIPRYINLTRVV